MLKTNRSYSKEINGMKRIYPIAMLSVMLVTSSSVFAGETDDRIEASAKKSYVFKTYLKDDAIRTESKNGIVTLTGTVADASHKAWAQDTVENLPGVKSVDNQLKIKGEMPAEHSDGWIATKVKSTLLFHRNVRATKTDVNVKDGVVILSGEASSMAQKELTTEYAKDVEGVKSVKNEMTVATAPVTTSETVGEKIDDASITAQVKSALVSHRSTSAFKTKVSTTDGIVTVSGSAKNEAEKSLVTKLVSDIHGVISVNNNMVVAPVAAK
ncbi:MAG: transport-associated protein [Verrucomicrobia bacterium]|jgi:osmotically-inducible protein OsmY|nr:transport-associated protein [Verrucomicrobiota bacterium]